ncbi:UNVERIFIED_CONTAM: hypothetical protein K2H54_033184 [Gekko kuhli]
MECVQVPPMQQQQQQQGKAAEGDRLLLLLPPNVQKEEAETVLRPSGPWAASQEDSGPGGTGVRDPADFSSHLQNLDGLCSPAVGSHPDGGIPMDRSATTEDLPETGAEAGEPLQPDGKETSGLSVREDLSVGEVAPGDASLAAVVDITARECLRDAEKSPQQNSCLQETSDSPSQNCSLGVDARTGGECPQDDQSDQASLPAEDGKLKPGAKRVTFPCDEDIVSGAVEPKDPWRHDKPLIHSRKLAEGRPAYVPVRSGRTERPDADLARVVQ